MTHIDGKTHRNGIIEWMRLLFIVTIMLGHAQGIFDVDLSIHGGTTLVEFFFMITGFYLAKELDGDVGQIIGKGGIRETTNYIVRKFKRYVPYTLPSVLIGQYLAAADYDWYRYGVGGVVSNILSVISETLMIKSTMFDFSLRVNPLWTLNAMLPATFIVIMIINCKSKLVKEYIPAIIGIVVYSNIEWVFGSGEYPFQLARAIGGMCLGTTIYNLQKNKRVEPSEKLCKQVNLVIIILSIIAVYLSTTEFYIRRAVLIILFFVVYLVTRMPSKYGNSVTDFIGKLCMGLYILHYPLGCLIKREFPSISSGCQIMLYFTISVSGSLFIYFIVSFFDIRSSRWKAKHC